MAYVSNKSNNLVCYKVTVPGIVAKGAIKGFISFRAEIYPLFPFLQMLVKFKQEVANRARGKFNLSTYLQGNWLA